MGAAARSPAPLDLLRPTVKACTRRYASKIRFGRGFSLAEIRAAGLTPAFARTVGIAVDHRRHGSNQMEDANIQRLTTYKANLVLFPRVEGKAKKGEINDLQPDSIPHKTLKVESFLFQLKRLELVSPLSPRTSNPRRSTEPSEKLELIENTVERELRELLM